MQFFHFYNNFSPLSALPIFIKPLSNVSAIEGYSLKLDVKVSGEPIPELKWFKDGQAISPNQKGLSIITRPNGSSSLIIYKSDTSDSGHYSVEAFNSFGKNKTEGEVKVTRAQTTSDEESPPSFVSGLSDCVTDEGKTLKFEAILKGNPTPDINWFHNGEAITSSNSTFISFDGRKVTLEIPDCNESHKGSYECKLINKLGTKSSEAKAEVRGKYAPKFIQKLSDVNTGISVPLKLTCRVSGNPDPNVQWFFDGHAIESGLKYSIQRKGQTLHLTINNPTLKDTGVYECHAKNICGFDSTRSSVTFSEKLVRTEPASFLKKFSDYECREGQSAKFTACIAGIPKPDLKWFKDGVQFEPNSSRHYVDLATNGIVRFTVRNVEPSDAGVYQLSISNSFGSDSSSANLTLESKQALE